MLSKATIYKLVLQRSLGRIFVIPLSYAIIALLKFKLKYKIHGLKEIRQQFSEICRQKKPFIICANHLTLIDSIVLLWALASPLSYLANYSRFSWNFPALENAKRYLSWSVITFLNKCILVQRLGDADHTDSLLEQMAYLLKTGDNCMLFPEGTRSRSGRVNPELVNYGIGKVIQRIPECLVLCIYIRSNKQETYSDFPAADSEFSLKLDLIQPTTQQSGLRGARDIANQVIMYLKQMEDAYFDKTLACSNGQ